MFTIINLADTFEQWLVERNLIFKFSQHGLYLLLNLAQLRRLVGFHQSKEDARDTIEHPPTLLKGEDGILESGRILVLYNLGYLVAFLLNGSLKGGQIVRRLDLTKVGCTKRQGALLKQRIFALSVFTSCKLRHSHQQHKG